MIWPVLRYPNPALKRRCLPAARFNVLRIVSDLIDTMRSHPGCVGLAAPQIGANTRVAVVDVTGHRLASSSHGLIALVDPEITMSSDCEVRREGCLSLPDITADVSRATRILFTSQGIDGPRWSDGFEARAIQHELDHLDGILILDRVEGAHSIHSREAAGARQARQVTPSSDYGAVG